jgi:hypothetical protein
MGAEHLLGMKRETARKWTKRALAVLIVAVLVLGSPGESAAYAVLSHQAIVDAAWNTHIKPLLLKRYPKATEEELSEAQAYSYGGAIIQDMG